MSDKQLVVFESGRRADTPCTVVGTNLPANTSHTQGCFDNDVGVYGSVFRTSLFFSTILNIYLRDSVH